MAAPYNAFISYSHKADTALARALQSELQRFAKPWNQLRALRLFRDETSLPATSELGEMIETALRESEYFLLLASPAATASPWVRREVAWWLEHKSPQTMLIALTDGQIKREPGAKDFDWERTDALPPNLKGIFRETPLWVDLRWAKDPTQFTTNHPEFRSSLAALAAPLRGMSKDELISEEAIQHHRTMRIVWTAGAFFAALIVALSAAFVLWRWSDDDAKRSASQKLAQQSEIVFGQDDVELAALLGRTAFETAKTSAARRAVLKSVAQGPLVTLGKGAPQDEDEYKQPIRDVTFSPAGDAVVSLEAEGLLRVWQLSRMHSPSAEEDVGKWVHSVEVSPDGKTIMAIGSTSVSLWDFATLDPVCSIPDLHGVTSAVFHADGQSILVGAGNDVWRASFPPAEAGASCPRHETLPGPVDPARVTVVTVAANRWVAAGRSDGSVSLWRPSAAGWELAPTIVQPSAATDGEWPTPAVRRLVFNPAGSELIVADDHGVLNRWDLQHEAPTGEVLANTATVIDELTFGASGNVLVVGDRSGRIDLWDARKWVVSNSFELNLADVLSIAVSPDLSRLATGGLGNDGATRLWSLSGSPLAGTPRQIGELKEIVAAAFDPSSARFAVAGADHSVRTCVEDDGGMSCDEPRTIGSPVSALAFSADGRWLALGEDDGTITITGGAVGDQRSVSLDGYRVVGLAFNADDSTLAATGQRDRALGRNSDPEETIALWDLATLERRDTLPEESAGHALAFSPSRPILAAVGGNQAVAWTEAAGSLSDRKIAGGPTAGLQELAFSHDGNRIAGGADDGSVVIWDVVGEPTLNVRINPPLTDEQVTASATSLAFSADGRFLASGHADGSLMVWSVDDQASIGLLGRLNAEIIEVAWLDGNAVVAIAGDGSYVAIPGNAEAWKLRACEVAGRDFEPSEAKLYFGNESRRVC